MCKMFSGQPQENYTCRTRSMRVNGQCTSVRLEEKFWRILDEIAAKEGRSTPLFISKLHTEVFELHGEVRNFTSLLRCACLLHMEKQQQVEAA